MISKRQLLSELDLSERELKKTELKLIYSNRRIGRLAAFQLIVVLSAYFLFIFGFRASFPEAGTLRSNSRASGSLSGKLGT